MCICWEDVFQGVVVKTTVGFVVTDRWVFFPLLPFFFFFLIGY